jgi:hypothetical protein
MLFALYWRPVSGISIPKKYSPKTISSGFCTHLKYLFHKNIEISKKVQIHSNDVRIQGFRHLRVLSIKIFMHFGP